MASKKGKKSKGTTLSLQEFNSLHEGSKASSGQNVVYVPKSKQVTSWADEVEEDDTEYVFQKIALPSAPRAVRGPNVDESQIPKDPPYTAHLGNLSYDIQDDDVEYFFRDLQVMELRLPRDTNSNRLRGFGYVKFGTREDLIQALCLNETMLKGRPVRVNLQGPGQGGRFDNDGGSRRGGDRGGGPPSEFDTPDDWRSSTKGSDDFGGPPPRGGGGGGYDSYNRRDREDRGPRRDMYGGGGGMMGGEGMDGMGGEFSFDRSSMNQGPPPMMERPPRRDYERGDRDGGFNRDRGDRDGGFNRDRGDRDGGGFNRDRAPPSYEEEDEGPIDWRSNMKPREDPPMRSRDREPSFERRAPEEPRYRNRSPPEHMNRSEAEAPKPEPPRERKKLVLAPRTAPLEATDEQKPEGSSSIFGGAKPVDTAAREREIEEKLAQSSIKPDSEVAAAKPRDGPTYSDSEGERDDEPKSRPADHQRNRRYNDARHGSVGRRTPDSDRNAEKEKDSHSEPEDDRDTHRYVGEKSYSRENEDIRRDQRPRREIHLRTGDRGGDQEDWSRDGPRRDGPRRNDGPRRMGGGAFDDREPRPRRDFQDSEPRPRRDFQDSERGEFRRGDNRRGGPGRQNSDDRDRDYNSRSRNTDVRLDRNFSDRGNNRGNNRRGGPALQEKSVRPNRNVQQRDDFPRDKQYDSEGFEVHGRGAVTDRPLPKHVDERQPINTNFNKFGALQTDDNDIGSD